MHVTLHVWRQAGPDAPGTMETYDAPDISEEMSFLEMLDIVNERLNAEGREPIAFEHDCREGICGSCGMMINGQAHGPQKGTATCQLHMRKFADGDEIFIEPWRARAFPVLKDLIVDRAAFDQIVEAGGYITAPTGAAPDANLMPIPKEVADAAMDAAACIGCGACVAACPNSAAQLFTVGQAQPPQPAARRARPSATSAPQAMVDTMEDVLRLLHEPRRVPGGVPEGDLDRLHRLHEPRLRQGPAQEPQAPQPGLTAFCGRCARHASVSVHRSGQSLPSGWIASSTMSPMPGSRRSWATSAATLCRCSRARLEDLEDDRQEADADDHEDRDLEVLLDHVDLPEEVAEQRDAEGPDRAADDVELHEGAVVHPADAGRDRREGADDRHEAGQDDGLGPYLSKNAWALSTFSCLKNRESGRWNSAGPTRWPNR